MSNWDNEVIFEAYKKQNIPLEESISFLLKNDLILATDIYNEWSMSDWHSGVKNVAQKAANVGGFLMDKVKKYIVEPLLGKNREVLSKLSKVKTKEELAQLLKTYGEDAAFQLINNEAITNAERRVQNNESYLGFWDLILLEASEIDSGLKSAILELGNSLGEGGSEIFKDLAETNISLDEVDGNDNLKRLCKFVAGLIENDSEQLDEVVKLAVVLSNLESVLEPTDDDYEKKYGTEIKKIISNKFFQSASEKDIVSAIKGGKSKKGGESKQELEVVPKTSKSVAKVDKKTKKAASALQKIAKVMPTEPKDVQTVINLISNPDKIQGEAKKSLVRAIKKGGKASVADVIKLADQVSKKTRKSKKKPEQSKGTELALSEPQRKFELKDVINLFKLVDLFFQRFAPQIKNLKLALQQSSLSVQPNKQQEKTTVGSLMAERYGIKDVNQAIQILSKSSDPTEIAKAVMFVTFEKNANEEVEPEQLDSVELGLAKKMNQWIDEIKRTKSTSKFKESYIQKGFDKNVVEALANAFARLSKVADLDVEEISAKPTAESEMNEIESMVDRISKGDEKLKQDILNALSSAEERIQQAKDAEEKKQRTEELRAFLLSKGFATEENISHVMAALDHLGRGGLVKPHEPVGGKPQQVNTTEGLKAKVKEMGSTSFFKIAYDIIMDRQKMMSLGVGMAILFVCFLLFGAPFLALLYVAIKAKQSEGGQEQEVEQPKEQETQQPSAMSNLKQTVVDKTKEVANKAANAVTSYIKPKSTTT